MLKDESIHFSLSILAGTLVGFLTGNFWAIPLALASGFFVDIDHVFDYLLFKRFRGLNIKEFFSGSFFDKSGKVILIFHGIEHAAVFLILGFIFPAHSYIYWSLGLSLLLHLLYDVISNKPRALAYSILFRTIHKFDHGTMDFKCH